LGSSVLSASVFCRTPDVISADQLSGFLMTSRHVTTSELPTVAKTRLFLDVTFCRLGIVTDVSEECQDLQCQAAHEDVTLKEDRVITSLRGVGEL
jgi:hypothetical protein